MMISFFLNFSLILILLTRLGLEWASSMEAEQLSIMSEPPLALEVSLVSVLQQQSAAGRGGGDGAVQGYIW